MRHRDLCKIEVFKQRKSLLISVHLLVPVVHMQVLLLFMAEVSL